MASRADIKAALLLSRGNVVEAAGRCASKFEKSLNDDEIVNAYLWKLCQKSENFFLSSLNFIPGNKLRPEDFDQENTRGHLVLAPVNVGDNHWCLLWADLSDSMIYWADSLAKNDGQDQMKKAGALINELTDFNRKWGFLAVVKAPLQTDTNNSGVFVCMFARMLIEGRLLNTYAKLTMKQPTAKDLESERALIAHELAVGEVV